MPKSKLTPEEQQALIRERQRRYAQKPEAIAKRSEYYRRPEVRARYVERAKTPEYKAYQTSYRTSEEAKARARRYASERLGFPPGMYDALLALQEGKCAICRRLFSDFDHQKLHSDHCHESQTPRGLLCHHCNLAEGVLKKTGLTPTEFAERLVHYLSNPPASYVTLV